MHTIWKVLSVSAKDIKATKSMRVQTNKASK